MTKYLLLEWVGWWTVASYNGECPGLFNNDEAAYEWVHEHYHYPSDSEEYAVEVKVRFRVIPIEVPADIVWP